MPVLEYELTRPEAASVLGQKYFPIWRLLDRAVISEPITVHRLAVLKLAVDLTHHGTKVGNIRRVGHSLDQMTPAQFEAELAKGRDHLFVELTSGRVWLSPRNTKFELPHPTVWLCANIGEIYRDLLAKVKALRDAEGQADEA